MTSRPRNITLHWALPAHLGQASSRVRQLLIAPIHCRLHPLQDAMCSSPGFTEITDQGHSPFKDPHWRVVETGHQIFDQEFVSVPGAHLAEADPMVL